MGALTSTLFESRPDRTMSCKRPRFAVYAGRGLFFAPLQPVGQVSDSVTSGAGSVTLFRAVHHRLPAARRATLATRRGVIPAPITCFPFTTRNIPEILTTAHILCGGRHHALQQDATTFLATHE